MDTQILVVIVLSCCVVLISLLSILGVRLGVIILGIGFLSEQYLVDFDIGPFSLRVYIYGVLSLGVAAWTILKRDRRNNTNGFVLRFMLIYAAVIGWQLFLDMTRGESIPQVAGRLLAGPGLVMAVIILGQSFVTRLQDVRLMMGLFAGATLLSGIFAIMQWWGVDWAWSIAQQLRSGTDSNLVMEGLKSARGQLSAAEAVTWTPGLSLFSVTLNTQLMAMGFIPFFWGVNAGLQTKKGKWILGVFSGLLAYVAVFISQQRSGILIVPIMLLVYLIMGRNRDKSATNSGVSEKIIAVGVFAVIVMGIYGLSTLGEDTRPQFGSGGYRLDRLNSFPMMRIDLAKVALEVFSESPLTGDRRLFMARSWVEFGFSSTPHNLFLTSMAFYGLPGLLLSILLCCEMWRFGRALLQKFREQSEDYWIGHSIVFGLLAHTGNAMFHNPSLLTGDTLPAWLIGVGAGFLVFCDRQKARLEISQ